MWRWDWTTGGGDGRGHGQLLGQQVLATLLTDPCPKSCPARPDQARESCPRAGGLLPAPGVTTAWFISTGVGEATLPGLVRRSRFPLAVAAATSTVVVAGAVVGAALTHMVQLAAHGGLSAIPGP